MVSEGRVYIAGPMTGIEHYNVDEFRRVQREWQDRGYAADTPFEANSRVWRRYYGRDFDPRSDRCEYGDRLLREMFAEDIATLLRADLVSLLDGWQDSTGTNLEKAVADAFSIPVVDERGDPLAESVALEADRLVGGARQADYGHPLDDFTRTGRLWAPILESYWQPGEPVPPEAVALCMVQVKVSRECNHPKRDNRVDGCGYLQTLDMVIAERERRTSGSSRGMIRQQL